MIAGRRELAQKGIIDWVKQGRISPTRHGVNTSGCQARVGLVPQEISVEMPPGPGDDTHHDDRVFHEGLGAHKLVVARVVHHVKDTGLARAYCSKGDKSQRPARKVHMGCID